MNTTFAPETVEAIPLWRPAHEMSGDLKNPQSGSIRVRRKDAMSPEFHDYLKSVPSFNIIAEGDSWFDLPRSPFGPGGLINGLERTPGFGYSILNLAERGETLDTMAYGTMDEDGNYQRPGMDAVVAAARIHKPKAFLFSAGGNDFAGPEFKMLLNHKASHLPALRKAVIDDLIHSYIKKTYLECLQRLWSVSPATKAFLHGYAYSYPTGIGYKVGPIVVAGPWLLPSLLEKTYNSAEGRGIVMDVIKEFAKMLTDVAATDGRIFVMDFTKHIGNQRNDWHDELHLTWDGYLIAASHYAKLIRDNI